MIRLILVVVVLVLASIGGAAVALHHFFGWKGLIAFPFLLLALVWIAKLVIGKLIKHFAIRLFNMKAGALRGATMKVHSVEPVAKPVEVETTSDEGGEGVGDTADVESDDSEKPKRYYAVELTITPQSQGQGKAVSSVWEPGELILASEKISGLEELREKQIGWPEKIEIWKGTAFGADDEGKYPGEQRLKVIFEVDAGKTRTWVYYYDELIGELNLPEGQPLLAPA